MAVQSYNPATRTAGTTADALERLRNLEIVNRFDGSSLTDASNTVLGTTDNFVTIGANRNVGTGSEGVHAVIGKTIFIDGNVTLAANAAGVHFQFFNCNIIYRTTGSNGTTTPPIGTGQNLNSDEIDARVSEGPATTRSVSFYGCNFMVSPTAAANTFTQFSDAFNSTITHVGSNIPLPCFNVGSRAINFTVISESVANSVIELYGAPEISEGLVVRNNSIEITGTGASTAETYQLLYTSPDFTGPGNQQRWRTQGSATAQSAFQVIGPFNPFNNVLNDTRRTAAGDNSVQTFAHLRDSVGQVLNYYGWTPGFFSDLAQTEPIQNVNARLRTSALLANTTINGINGQTSMLTAISNTGTGYNDLSGGAKNTQVIYKSDANGLLVADNTAQYSTNGTTFTTGWIDFLRLRPFNESGATAGGNETGITWFDQPAPNNTIFAPIAQVTGGAYTQYEADVDYRSYSHEVDFAEEQNGVIGTAAGNQASSTLSPIDDSNTIAGVNPRIKATNVNADNSPNLDFNGTTPASLQDISNAVRSAWYQYEFDPNYDAGDANFPDAGPFNANTYPMNIVLSATAPTVTGNITFAEDGYGIGLVANVIEVAVHTNTLSALSNDILNNNPSNIDSITIGGRNIDGIVYNGTTSGNFGAITNGSNITTTNTDNQTVVSINGSTIDSVGQMTISGATVNSTVNSDGNVLFNSHINENTGDTGSATAGDNVSCLNNTVNNYSFTSLGTGDITFTGSTLSNVSATSADNINMTNATATGSNLNAADNINAAGTGTISSTTMVGDNINNIALGRFGNGNTYGDTGVTLNINFTGLSGVTTIDALLGTNRTLLGTVNLVSDAPVEVTITSVDDYAGINGVNVTQGNIQVIGNIRYNFPAVPPEDRTFTIPSTLAGEYIIQTGNTLGSVQTKTAGSPLVIIDTDDEQNVDYKIWWNPTSSWSGNAADNPVIYDYSYAAWNPSTMPSSSSIADFQPDPSGAVTGAATTVNVATFTPTTGGTLSSGVAEFTITSAQTTYTAIQAQTLAWQIQNSELYLLAIATADFDGTQRIIEFGSGDSTTYNSGGDLIRLNATGSQRILGASGGFLSTSLGPVMSVISADIILLSATLAQVAQASETSNNQVRANQVAIDAKLRNPGLLLRPYSSDDLPNP